jgi:hypothetical protein
VPGDRGERGPALAPEAVGRGTAQALPQLRDEVGRWDIPPANTPPRPPLTSRPPDPKGGALAQKSGREGPPRLPWPSWEIQRQDGQCNWG